jgi:hypothetical protein
MANHCKNDHADQAGEKRGDGVRSSFTQPTEAESQALPPESHTADDHPPEMQNISHGRRAAQAASGSQRSPFELSGMSAALLDVRPGTYSRRLQIFRQGQFRLTAGKGSSSVNLEYVVPQVMPLTSSQGMAPAQYFRQPYQQGRQLAAIQTNYTNLPMPYSHQNFEHPYLQYFQQLQTQQPMAYGHAGAGYYPVQQNFTRLPYENTPGITFRHDQGYIPPSNAAGLPAAHGGAPAGLYGQVSLQTGSSGESLTEPRF